VSTFWESINNGEKPEDEEPRFGAGPFHGAEDAVLEESEPVQESPVDASAEGERKRKILIFGGVGILLLFGLLTIAGGHKNPVATTRAPGSVAPTQTRTYAPAVVTTVPAGDPSLQPQAATPSAKMAIVTDYLRTRWNKQHLKALPVDDTAAGEIVAADLHAHFGLAISTTTEAIPGGVNLTMMPNYQVVLEYQPKPGDGITLSILRTVSLGK
jgi:hypothetical protein